MEQHVIVAELSAAGAQELTAATSSAHLAYNAGDGTPRVIPVGFFWTGTEFVISAATTPPKVAALRAHPDVALAIDEDDTPEQARALSVRVRVSVEIVDGLGWDRGGWYSWDRLDNAGRPSAPLEGASSPRGCLDLAGQVWAAVPSGRWSAQNHQGTRPPVNASTPAIP